MKRRLIASIVISFILLSWGVLQAQDGNTSADRLVQAPISGLYLVPAQLDGITAFNGAVPIHNYGQASLVSLKEEIPPGNPRFASIIPVNNVDMIQYRSWKGLYQPIENLPMSKIDQVGLLALVGPVDGTWHRELEKYGIEILDHAPPYGLVVSASTLELLESQKMMTSSGFQVIRGWVPMPVDAKISSDLMPIVAGERTAVEVKGLMTGASGNPYVRIFPYSNQDRVEVFSNVSQFATQVRGSIVYDHDNVFELRGSDIMNMIETLPGIAYVEGVYKRTLHNNLAVQDYIMNIEPVWGALGWDGTGVIVGHNDSGVDLNHPDLSGVVLATNGVMSNTDNGHGTHTAGSVAGRGGAANSPNNTSGCGDQNPPLNQIIGAAPGSQLVVNNIFDGGSTSEDLMMRWGYQNNSVLSTNSWGYGTNFTYSSNAAVVDARVRDADTTVGGNQEYAIIFSAGNSGPGSSTIGTPGNGKNTLTVGASQNDRCGSYVPSNCAGASIDLMACFSSRGPAQSRILPDVVGVGTDVISVESQDAQATYGWDEAWTGSQYALSPGTSMSCPLVAGATAVFFEFYASTFGSYPSPALSKAAMINGAVNIGTYGIPSYDQGWGRVDLRRSIEGPPGGEIKFVEQSSELATGQSWSLPFTVGSNAIPLKITMDWTDPPGAANCSSCLINDLDLVVTSPSGVVYKGNQFTSDWATPNPGGKDNVNNVECVYVQAPETGSWTMQVISAGTNQNPQGLSGQDFAVVYSGSFCSAQAPTGLIAAPNGNNQIDLNWNAATGSTEYRIYRSTTSGGPYTQIGTSAGTSYSDTTVSGSVTYYYVVTNFTTCESDQSSEASALATGTCSTEPTFSGLQTVTNAGSATCTLNLAWNAAISPCGNGITYNIYRSTDSAFIPAVGNRIATGSTTTTYSDSASLTYNVTYYYVVRAVDTGNGAEDTNTTRVSGVPTGSVTLGTWFDNVDSYTNIAAAVTAGWTHQAASGTDDWSINSGLDHTTGSANSFRSDSVTTVTDKSLISPPKTINTGSVLSFWHQYDFEDSGTTAYDGGVIEISTNGGSSWTDLGADITANGYDHTMSGSFSNPLGGQQVWSGAITNFVQVSVDLANYVGGSVLIRWRFACDSSTSRGPWYIDDIQITNTGVPGSCTTGGSCTDPGAPSITSITDNDPCVQDGVIINYTAGSGAASHDLYDNGSPVVTGFTSGSSYNPSDTASHSYVIRAIDATCFTESTATNFTDATGPGAPSITSITDADVCVQTGIHVNYTAGSGATSHSLWRDGTQVVANYASGALYDPGDVVSHSYVVRAVNGSCTADSGSSAFTDTADMPGTPSISSMTDDNSCTQSGIHVNYSAGSGATSHDLLRDGSVVVTGYVSGVLYDPGNSTSYSYTVRAVNGTCTAVSGAQSFTDAADGPGTPSITSITDDDSCAQTGIHINYNAGSGATSHSLWRDGSQVVATYVSGALYNPGDVVSHSYLVRAINGSCTADSGSSAFTDAANMPGTPSITSITDDNSCTQSGIHLNYSAGSGASSHDLLRDGTPVVTGYVSGALYDPGNSTSYSYTIRAVNGACTAVSGAQSFTDASDGPGTPSITSITDDDACALTGIHINYNAGSGATSHSLWRDGSQVVANYVSGSLYTPGDTASHSYVVRAINGACTADSGSSAFTDADGIPTSAAPTVSDLSACSLSGVQISWSAVSGATNYDILVDGTTTLQDVTSPHTYNPADSNPHTYQVRGRSASCNGPYSVTAGGSDYNYSLSFSGIGTATDRDACDDTGVVITWPVPASWNDGGSGSRTFTVYRGATDVSGPLSEGTTSYVDIGGTNGTSYNYSVAATNGYSCTAGSSATLAASDEVGSMPTFSGAQSVSALIGNVCGLRVTWNAATSNCGTGIVYNVYRSTTSGFTPSAGTNMIASCVSDLFYDDTAVSGLTTYYYVVRAEDSAPGHGGPCNDGFEDNNTAEFNGTPGGVAAQQLFFDDYDGNRPANPADYYMYGVFTGTTNEWHQPETQRSFSTTNSYSFGPGGGADYALDQDCRVVIGGDGSGPSGANGFAITSTGFTLSFYHTYDFEATYDGVALMYSTTGPLSGFNYIPDTVTVGSPYITTGGYTGTIRDLNAVAGWNGNQLAAWSQVIVNLDELNGQTVWFAWRAYSDYSIVREGYYFDDVKIEGVGQGNCVTAPSPVAHFTARSTGTNVKLEWQNPTTGYGSTHIRWDTAGYPADATSGTLLVDQVGIAGAYDTTTHSGLTNATTYYYSVFVDDGTGEFSSRQTVTARPFDTANKVKWAYQTSASSLAPPGVYPGAAGVGAAYVVSNDRVLHSMNSASTGGDWPRSAPFDWLPMGMNGPAQARPPIVPTTIGSANLVAFLGSLDGHIYAVNARTGQTLWQSAQNYTMVQGSAAGIFTGFGGAYDLIFAGSRVAGSGNSLHAMNPADGTHAWSFGGTIGIISSGAIVDYANSRLYFTSRQNPTGSADTLWCISFTGAGATLVWSKPYGDIDSTPVLYAGVLYVGNNSGEVMAVNPDTGATLWSFATGDGPIKGYVNFEFQALPRQLLFTTTNKVWSLTDHGTTVSETWQQGTVSGPSIPLTLANQGMLYIGSTDGKLYQVSTLDGSIVTSVPLGAGTATVGSPSYDYINSIAYIGTEDGSVYAVTLPLQ